MDDNTATSGETTLNPPRPPETRSEIEEIEVQEIKNRFYELIADLGWSINKNALLEYKSKFVRDPNTKQIYVEYNNKLIRLTSKKNPYKFLALHTIMQNYGKCGISFIRDVLGVENYDGSVSPKIPPPVEA